MSGGDAECRFCGQRLHIQADPVRSRPLQRELQAFIEDRAEEQDERHADSQARIDAPIDRRQHEYEELPGPKEGEEAHGRIQPGKRLKKSRQRKCELIQAFQDASMLTDSSAMARRRA